MRILNLYAGIGGNRKLWGNEHEITSVENKKEIADFYKHQFPNDQVILEDAQQYLLKHFREYDFIWTSPPCQTHSRVRFWGAKNINPVLPDLGLYSEIIFLKYYFGGKWVAENVNPYYEPLIKPTANIGRHLFWANFHIPAHKFKEADINRGNIKELEKLHGFDTTGYNFNNRKDQILRNCVNPDLGLYILNRALEIKYQEDIKQPKLF